MQTRDHKLLGRYLLRQVEQELPFLYKVVFIIGNVEPDCNPFTYLHGMLRGKKFHGHNYENILPIMKKLYCSLQKQESIKIVKYYHLGKLLHYTADAFTYPHNAAYKKGLIEHCKYESQLHARFLVMLEEEMKKKRIVYPMKDFKELEMLHKEYIQNPDSYIGDCIYILKVSSMIIKQELMETVKYIPIEKMAG